MTLPRSWDGPGITYLDQFNPLVSLLPPSTRIKFTEVAGDEAREAALRTETSSAATMMFDLDNNQWKDPVLFPIIYRTIVGGYSGVSGLKHKPMQHPYYPGLYARGIAMAKQRGITEPADADLYNLYATTRVVIDFESVPFFVDKPSSLLVDHNPNWIEIGCRASVNRVTTLLGSFRLAGSTPSIATDLSTMNGLWIPQQQNYITLLIHEVPQSAVFATDYNGAPLVGTLWPSIRPYLGSVNDQAFAGCPSQTLYFDSLEYASYTDPTGVPMCVLKLNIIFNGFKNANGTQWGWNLAPRPDGVLFNVVYRGLGPLVNTQPFLGSNWILLFQQLNPR